MKTNDYILAQILGCKDPFDVEKLDSIVYDPEYFEDLDKYTMDTIGKAVWQKALNYLNEMYTFARANFRQHKAQYDGSVLEWDVDLVQDAIDFLNPEEDLHWGYTSMGYYLEIDYWELYTSVIDTVCEDYGSGKSFNELATSFTTQFYGGEKVPDKYDSILL